MAEIPEWYMDFVSAVVGRLPRDIDEPIAIRWIQDPDALEQALRDSLLSAAGATATKARGGAVPAQLKHDKTAEGWTLVEDRAEPGRISGDSIELAAFPESDQGYIIGDEMVTLVQEIDEKLGQRHAEYLLEHQDEIPEDFQKFSLVFPGTIWLGRDSNHHVPCLTWNRGKWEMVFGILEAGVDSSDYLVRARS